LPTVQLIATKPSHAPIGHLQAADGVGPVMAATVIGEVRDVTRFPVCNGTAPIEVSFGNRKAYRLSRRGSRRVNHALHMATLAD
jgi:transposase